MSGRTTRRDESSGAAGSTDQYPGPSRSAPLELATGESAESRDRNSWYADMDRLFRMLAGTVLLASAVPHLGNSWNFLHTILEKHHWMGVWPAVAVAAVLPSIQLVTGMALIGGFLCDGASWLALFLFAAFWAVRMFGEGGSDCGCFGPRGTAATPWLGSSWFVGGIALSFLARNLWRWRVPEGCGSREELEIAK